MQKFEHSAYIIMLRPLHFCSTESDESDAQCMKSTLGLREAMRCARSLSTPVSLIIDSGGDKFYTHHFFSVYIPS